jgi:hypothetical protein
MQSRICRTKVKAAQRDGTGWNEEAYRLSAAAALPGVTANPFASFAFTRRAMLVPPLTQPALLAIIKPHF